MKRAIRDLLETIYGWSSLGYSGKTKTWWVKGKAFPVNLLTFYQLAARVTLYPTRYYLKHIR
jgi:hypothetical protein